VAAQGEDSQQNWAGLRAAQSQPRLSLCTATWQRPQLGHNKAMDQHCHTLIPPAPRKEPPKDAPAAAAN